MKIEFSSLFSSSSYVGFIPNKLPSLKQKVAILALAIFGAFTFYYFCCRKFRAPKIDKEKQDSSIDLLKREANSPQCPSIKKERIKEPVNRKALSSDLPLGKVKALEAYRKNQCGKIQKKIIFNDIKHIELKGLHKKDLISVVDLMLYLSGLSKIDLTDPLCARVVLDTFKECNQETSEQLSEWLGKQETFNANLLKDCLTVFAEKYQEQIPFSLYALELLMKTYKEKGWNQCKNLQKDLILPANHGTVASAMTILIQGKPNDNKISALTEWFLNQPEYDIQTFSKWIKIFKQKEQEKAAINLYYPLLDKMIAHFEQKWGSKQLSQLDPNIAHYLQLKKIPGKKPILP